MSIENDLNKLPFVHLRVFSSYSLLEGTLHPKDIVKLAQNDSMPAIAINDRNNLFGSLEFSEECLKNSVQPLISVLIKLEVSEKFLENNLNNSQKTFDYIVLFAKNDIGYKNLLYLSSYAYVKNKDIESPFINYEILQEKSEGLLAITGGYEGFIYKALKENREKTAREYLKSIYKIFDDNLYIEIARMNYESSDIIESQLIEIAYKYNIPLVATNPIYYKDSSYNEGHEVLTCIASNNILLEEDRVKYSDQHYFKTQQEMKKLFADIPEAIVNTSIFAQKCAVKMPKRDPILPHFPTKENRSEEEELRESAANGLQKRLDDFVFTGQMTNEEKNNITLKYEARLKYELDIIISMNFSGYFLIVSDFICYAKSKNIPVGPGRGSGAGSLVAWALYITDLDPIRFGLIFERFLNPERISMPDFDIDFCQERRGEVIEYVQKKYGFEHVAQILTIGKLQARAVLRDVGRVLGMPYGKVDWICKLIPNNPAKPVTLAQALDLDKELRETYHKDQDNKKLIDLGLMLEGLNRHVSMHAAGIVIGDRPLYELVPLYRDPRSEMPVTQFSMKYVEQSGLVKFDFLGLKTLTTIVQAIEIISNTRKEIIDINKINLNDLKTFQMLGTGNAVGVFQLESSGMRDTLCKLKPDNIEDIIALISLYRPGPMDNIPVYISCKHNERQPDYLHPKLKDVLKETFGVIIYQEQVMKIAQILAGYSLGTADLLRRAMGKKIQSEMDLQRKIFVDGAIKNGVKEDEAIFIFDLVNKFAGYGFNKSHAAAYALISYQTAWLKANYPQEFYVASINLDLNDTDKIYLFCNDARKNKIKILSPNINYSQAYFAVEEYEGEFAIRYGLAGLKSVGVQAAEKIFKEREANGKFKNIFDFAKRVNGKNLNKRILEALAKSGALDDICDDRNQIINSTEIILNYSIRCREDADSSQQSLFGESQDLELPTPKLNDITKSSYKERLDYEREIIGFYLDSHPLDPYMQILKSLNICFLENLDSTESGKIQIVGVVPDYKTKISAKGKYGFIQLSDPTGHCEFSLFNSDLLFNSRSLFDEYIPIIVFVDVRRDQGGVRIIAENIVSLDEYIANLDINYKLNIKDLSEIDKIKDKIAQCDKGRNKLHLAYYTKENHEVSIDTKSRIYLKPEIFAELADKLEIA